MRAMILGSLGVIDESAVWLPIFDRRSNHALMN